MSLRLMLDRTVTLRPMTDGAEDAQGNPARTPGTDVPDVRCRRQLLDVEEDIVGRDRQVQRFRYFFLPHDGPLALSGRDQIVDGAQVLEVDGEPEVVGRRHRRHHVEALAYLIEG